MYDNTARKEKKRNVKKILRHGTYRHEGAYVARGVSYQERAYRHSPRREMRVRAEPRHLKTRKKFATGKPTYLRTTLTTHSIAVTSAGPLCSLGDK